MKENEHISTRQNLIHFHPKHLTRIKQIHHSFWFWIFLVLMLLGILYYIFSGDFAFAPRKQIKPPIENNTAH